MNDAQCVDSGAENPYLAGRRSATYQATLTSLTRPRARLYTTCTSTRRDMPPAICTSCARCIIPYHNTQVGAAYAHHHHRVQGREGATSSLQGFPPAPTSPTTTSSTALRAREFSIYDASGKFVQSSPPTRRARPAGAGLLTAGTYTVKETKAPEGYYAADDFTVTVNAGQVTKKTVGDKPYDDPISMLVGKFDGEKTSTARATSRRGSATLADAEFTVDYYDTFDYDNYDDLKKADIEPTLDVQDGRGRVRLLSTEDFLRRCPLLQRPEYRLRPARHHRRA